MTIRKCIVCGSEKYLPLFTFDKSFMQDVRKTPPEFFETHEWKSETTSSIVKCGDCGTNFIRDVFTDDRHLFLNRNDEFFARHAANLFEQLSFANADGLARQINLLQRLQKLAIGRGGVTGQLSFLDYGASLGITAHLARAVGFDRVVAVDTAYPPDMAERFGQHVSFDVEYVNDAEQLLAESFDVVVCRSAIEHFMDPLGDITAMHRLMKRKGVLFINNPIMDLDGDPHYLKSEGNLTDKRIKNRLRKSYHIDHVNYLTPSQFRDLLRQVGLKVHPILETYWNTGVAGGFVINLARSIKNGVEYLLDLLRVPYKKINFYCVKQ